ncbi:MAG: hypothetical protein ACYTGQ_04745 [Planctomycetota bacterium]|jgi:hypothetical protein
MTQHLPIDHHLTARLGNEACRFLRVFALCLVTPLLTLPTHAAPEPEIKLHQNKGEYSFRLNNLSPGQLTALNKRDLPDTFAVYATTRPDPDFPAMSGSYRFAKNTLIFSPRYPLQPGLTYTAVFNHRQTKISQAFAIPKPPAGPPARVTAVYPSTDTLPENLLRFYIHFSKPMSRGQAYRRITLFDHNTGQVVDRPFLELEEELWDPDAKRFTLLFDPGRVKEGLKPREEVGPSLMRNHRYTLRIDAAWLDAHSNPMAETYERAFTVTEPDTTQPDVANWELTPPQAGTPQPLTVRFAEPLDHGQVHRLLTVQGPNGKTIPGAITVDRHETRWSFTPNKPWPPGAYRLVAATILEDRAANSLGRPFEVDMDKRDYTRLGEYVTLKFEIK